MAKTFTIGDKVFAKVRGYAAWPARVEGVAHTSSKTKYNVLFYGTSQTAVCKVEDLYHYAENKEKYGKPLKRKGFKEALAQIEELPPVPQSMPRAELKHEAEDSDGEGNLVIDESPEAAGESGQFTAIKVEPEPEPEAAGESGQHLSIKLEPHLLAAAMDPGPDLLAPLDQPKLEAAIKAKADWPGGLELAARVGPDRWLAAVRLTAADRVAAEAQMPRQQLPALANIKEEADYIDPELEFAEMSESSEDSCGEQYSSHEEWEPPEPRRRTRGRDGEFLVAGAAAPLQVLRRFGLRCAGPRAQRAAAQHPGSAAGSSSDHGQTSGQSGAQQQPMRSAPRKDNPLQCQECGKRCTRLYNLQRHKLLHSGMRPFECPDCRASFKLKHHLERHSYIHTGEKPHRCDECNRAFAQLITLQRHKVSHTGARPYSCPDCSQRFTRSGSLQTHKRAVHLKLRPHACSDCEKCFAQKKHLRKHALTHSRAQMHACTSRHCLIQSGKRLFSCDSCGCSFRLKKYLRRHAQIHVAPGGN